MLPSSVSGTPGGGDEHEVHVPQRLPGLGPRHDVEVPVPAVGVHQVEEAAGGEAPRPVEPIASYQAGFT